LQLPPKPSKNQNAAKYMKLLLENEYQITTNK